MKADLQGEALLGALSAVALAVHRARSYDGVLEVAAEGLRRIGMSWVAVEWRSGDVFARSHNLALPEKFAKTLGPLPWMLGTRKHQSEHLPLRTAEAAGRPLYFDDMAVRLAPHFAAMMPPERVAELVEGFTRLGFGQAVVAPVKVRDDPWGGLVLSWPGMGPDATFAVGLFALQFGAALEAAVTIERLEARNRELEVIHELATAGPNQSAESLAQTLLKTLCRVTVSDVGIIFRYDAERKELIALGTTGLDAPLETDWERFVVPDWIMALVAPVGFSAEGLPADGERVRRLGFSHVAVGPLVVEGRPVGMLALGRRRDELYGAAELQVVERLGAQAAAFLERARLYEEASRRVAQLSLLYDLAHTGATTREVQPLVDRLLARMVETFPADIATLHFLFGQQFTLSGWKRRDGDTVRVPTTAAIPLNADSVIGQAALTRKLVARSTADFPEFTRRNAVAQGFTQLMCAPLEAGGKLLGCVSVARQGGDFSAAEGALLESVAAQVAVLVEQARLYDDLRRSYQDLSRAQAEVVRHERLAALGEVAAVMAHEVRNPLGVIFNSLTSLKKLVPPSPDVELLLRIVGEEADRLNRIVGDLLDFARPYAPERTSVALETVVASAVQAASTSLGTAGIRIVTEFPEVLPEVPLDGYLLRQALVNLVVNAIQAMPRGGTVTVRVALERKGAQGWARIAVSDQGPGISPGAAERIFQPFFTTKATGTGLGLAVVKRIVDALSGEVLVDTGLSGTTFTLRLPLQ